MILHDITTEKLGVDNLSHHFFSKLVLNSQQLVFSRYSSAGVEAH